MSAPVYQGTPDYLRREPYADQILINDSGTTDSTGKSYGPFYVGNIRALYMRAEADTNFLSVQFVWLDKSPGGTQIENSFMDVGAPQILRKSFRPYTPWLQINITAPLGQTVNFQMLLTTMADVTIPKLSPAQCVGVSIAGAGIGAGATVVTVATNAHIGEAFFEGFVTGGSWVMNCEVVSSTGGITVVSRAANDAGRFAKRIYIPSGKVQVRVTNTAAGASLYDVVLVYRPDASG